MLNDKILCIVSLIAVSNVDVMQLTVFTKVNVLYQFGDVDVVCMYV